MRTILHILTTPEDALAKKIIESQRANADHKIQKVDLTQNETDYPALVEQIFAADSVQVW